MKLTGRRITDIVFLSLDDPGEEEEEGDVYLTLLAATPQTRAANHTVDKASPESGKSVDTVANYCPLFLHLQCSTVGPSHKSHSPTHTIIPTQHSPAHTVTQHPPAHKPDSQEEFPSATHQKKPSWGRSEVSVCSRLPLLPLLLPPLSWSTNLPSPSPSFSSTLPSDCSP